MIGRELCGIMNEASEHTKAYPNKLTTDLMDFIVWLVGK